MRMRNEGGKMKSEIIVLIVCALLAAIAAYARLRVAGDADRREEKLQQEREKEKNGKV